MTFAIHLRAIFMYLGFDMKSIQMWLGHGTIGTAMNIYAHIGMAPKKM